MKDFLKKQLDSIITRSIWEILKYIIGLAFTSGFFGFLAKIITNNISVVKSYSNYIFILALCLGGFLFIILYERFCYKKPNIPEQNVDYEILCKELIYTYIDKENMRNELNLKLKALKNDLDRYIGRFVWSGSGSVKNYCGIKSHSYREAERKDAYIWYEILFNRNLKKGKNIDVKVIREFYDEHNKAVPFLSSTVNYPTKKINTKSKVTCHFISKRNYL